MSRNPFFRDSALEADLSREIEYHPMTIEGTSNKILLLSFILLCSAGAIYYQFSLGHHDMVSMAGIAGIIIGFILALIVAFVPRTAPALAPIYALCEGAGISWISCNFEASYPGIIVQAVAITMFAVLAMAILYRLRIIRATEKFRAIIFSASLAIFIFYLISIVLMLFGVRLSYFACAFSPIFMFLNFAIAVIATLNLILDFDFIEKGAERGLPSYFEWYGAHGTLVTIIWMYLEILRLLARARNR